MPGPFCPTSSTPREKKGDLLQEERIFWYWLVDNEYRASKLKQYVLGFEITGGYRSAFKREIIDRETYRTCLVDFFVGCRAFPCDLQGSLALLDHCTAQSTASVSTVLEDIDVSLDGKIWASVPVLLMLKFPWK